MERNDIDMKIMDDVLYNFRRIKGDIYVDGAERILRNKIRLKDEYEKRQKLRETRLKEYNKRIDKIQTQRDIRNNKRIEVNREREEQIKKKIQTVKTQERLNHIKLMQHIKRKGIRTQKLLIDRKTLRSRQKQIREIERYGDRFKHENTIIPDNQLIIDKCIKNKGLSDLNDDVVGRSYEEEIENEPHGEIIKEECYIDSDQSVS